LIGEICNEISCTTIAIYHISHHHIVNTGQKNHVRIITTGDGSHSLYHEGLHETYHSTHGALRESMHVFIHAGLFTLIEKRNPIRILEVGFGTGLNAWLTIRECLQAGTTIHYVTLEPFPIPMDISTHLNYGGDLVTDHALLTALHEAPWETEVVIQSPFSLLKTQQSLQSFHSEEKFDLIYYDAFGPPSQPEMWTAELLHKVASMMNDGGVFVTYCAKGQVRRDLAAAGLKVERLAGPPGKREMLRAIKS